MLNASSNRVIKISLNDDMFYELPESFEVNLSFFDNMSPPTRVSISQATARVIIIDDDGQLCMCLLMQFDLICYVLILSYQLQS